MGSTKMQDRKIKDQMLGGKCRTNERLGSANYS